MKKLCLIILILLLNISNLYSEKPHFKVFHKKHHAFKEKPASIIKLIPYYGDDSDIHHNNYNKKNRKNGSYRAPGYQIRYKHGLTASKHYFYLLDFRTHTKRVFIRVRTPSKLLKNIHR